METMEMEVMEADLMQETGKDESIGQKSCLDKNDDDDDDQRAMTKKIHRFYFVKFRSFEVENLKSRIKEAENLMKIKEQDRCQIIKNLHERMLDREHICQHLVYRSYLTGYTQKIGQTTNEMERLQQSLGELCCSMNLSKGRAKYALSPVEELNDLIMNLQCQLQHGRNNIAKEKKLLGEIKKAEAAREILVANVAAERTKIPYHLNSREPIKNRIKAVQIEIEALKKEELEYRDKKKHIKAKLEGAEKDISFYRRKLEDINQKKSDAYKTILGLRKHIDDADECFNQYLKVLDSAKELASKKDVEGLMELSNRQVENFMTQWRKSKDFREDYERRSLPFLESRQLSRKEIRMGINPSRGAKRDFPKASQDYI